MTLTAKRAAVTAAPSPESDSHPAPTGASQPRPGSPVQPPLKDDGYTRVKKPLPLAARRIGSTGTGNVVAFRGAASAARIAELLKGWTTRKDEAEILSILSQASAADLNAILAQTDVQALFSNVDNHILGAQNNTELRRLLSVTRVQDLSVENRAAIVDALHRGGVGAADEQTILNVFQATTGRALTALKNSIDSGGDHYDLMNLVFKAIAAGPRRDAMIMHIGASEPPSGEVRILSDIDDTFYCNYKDKRFPKGTVYPGIRALYAELDAGAAGTGRSGDLAFLTARPDVAGGMVEDATHSMLRGRGVSQAVVIGGDVAHVFSNHAIAAKKTENFERFHFLYPEYTKVFLGDNGQGDQIAGGNMLRFAPSTMKAVFIHNVVGASDADRRAALAEGITLVDSYVDAAVECYARGLISGAGLQRIVDAARGELAQIRFDSAAQRAAAEAIFNRATTRAAQALSTPVV